MKKFMQWGLATLATFVLVLGGISSVSAVDLAYYEEGVLVPRAMHNGSNIDTVVGLTANATGTVYWTFFSRDSEHLYDSYFDVTKNDLYQFSLSAVLGGNLIGEEGYLVFSFGGNDTTVGNGAFDDETLAANAFLVDTSTDDAIFVPVLPLDESDYLAGTNLEAMDAGSIIAASYGTWIGIVVDIRYWIDPAFSAATQMVVWTVGNPIATSTVNVYDDEEHRTSLTICWRYSELNLWDPTDTGTTANSMCTLADRDGAAAFTAWPSSYIDGFMRITMPEDGIAYSYITSTAFGAAQTLLAGEHW